MNIENLGKGCIPDKVDKRDYIIEDILGAPESFDWEKGFDIEDKVGQLKVESQSKSLSCVGQMWQYYLQVLEIIETGKFTDLSAKDIYSRIFMPQGGARLRDGAKLAVSRGVATERSNPSYMNGKPPTEAFMREIISGLEEEAKQFRSKSYATTTHNSIDFFASYIRDFHGVVGGVLGDNAGWQNEMVKPPVKPEWGHALYFGRARMINGKKYLGFLNSWSKDWGDNGWGWLGQDYFGTVNYENVLFNIWTLIDNIKTMNYVLDEKSEQYLLDETLKIALNIGDEKELIELQKRGLHKQPTNISNSYLKDYLIYPLVRKSRWGGLIKTLRDLSGF